MVCVCSISLTEGVSLVLRQSRKGGACLPITCVALIFTVWYCIQRNAVYRFACLRRRCRSSLVCLCNCNSYINVVNRIVVCSVCRRKVCLKGVSTCVTNACCIVSPSPACGKSYIFKGLSVSSGKTCGNGIGRGCLCNSVFNACSRTADRNACLVGACIRRCGFGCFAVSVAALSLILNLCSTLNSICVCDNRCLCALVIGKVIRCGDFKRCLVIRQVAAFCRAGCCECCAVCGVGEAVGMRRRSVPIHLNLFYTFRLVCQNGCAIYFRCLVQFCGFYYKGSFAVCCCTIFIVIEYAFGDGISFGRGDS